MALPLPYQTDTNTLLPGIIKPRQAVAALSPYLPPLEGRRNLTRLDFNENTNPPIPQLGQCLYGSLLEETAIYPEYDQFLEKLSETWNVPKESLLITNGSDEGLSVIAWTFIEPKTDTALTVTPTFALIPHSLKLAESKLVEIPYADDWSYDTVAIESELKKGIKLAVFASPDNPTGAVLPLATLERWVKDYPNTLFVMDEAYAEYAGQTALELSLNVPNLLVTRTFSKAWGLAGLRLGVVIGNPSLISELKKVRSPYSVNIAAINAAETLLPQYNTILANASDVMARKTRILQEVQARDYEIVPGYGNFFMMGLGLASKLFCSFMKANGILVRDRSSMHTRLQGFVRVSVGTDSEMKHFLETLDRFQQETVVLFDVDGTLVDTTKSFDAVVEQLVEKYSGKPLADTELKSLREEGGFNDDWEATVELLKRRGVFMTFAQIAEEGFELYLTVAKETESWLLNPQALGELGKRFRLGIVTGRTCAEFDPIWKERMAGYLDCMVCQDSISDAKKKPAPDLLQGALQQMKASQGFYIGNSVDDMQAAIAAGLMPVAVLTTLSADALIQAGAQALLLSPDDIASAFQLP